jgi:hypothetical protein
VKPQNLQRGEWIAMAGAALLAVAVFLAWYHLDGPNAKLESYGPGDSPSAWQVHPIMRWLLLAASAAPFILAWIVIREHQLSWPRGEVTMVVAITAIGLIFYTGVISRPGDPSGDIKLRIGWYLALLGGILMLAGSVIRQGETERGRKPPGTL